MIAKFPTAYGTDPDHPVSIHMHGPTEQAYGSKKASIPCIAFLGQYPSPGCPSPHYSLGFLSKTKPYHVAALFRNLKRVESGLHTCSLSYGHHLLPHPIQPREITSHPSNSPACPASVSLLILFPLPGKLFPSPHLFPGEE